MSSSIAKYRVGDQVVKKYIVDGVVHDIEQVTYADGIFKYWLKGWGWFAESYLEPAQERYKYAKLVKETAND